MELKGIKVDISSQSTSFYALPEKLSASFETVQNIRPKANHKAALISAIAGKAFRVTVEVPRSFEFGAADGLLVTIAYGGGLKAARDSVHQTWWLPEHLVREKDVHSFDAVQTYLHTASVDNFGVRNNSLLMPGKCFTESAAYVTKMAELYRRLAEVQDSSVTVTVSAAPWNERSWDFLAKKNKPIESPHRNEPPEGRRLVVLSERGPDRTWAVVRRRWFTAKKDFTFQFVNIGWENASASKMPPQIITSLGTQTQNTSDTQQRATVQKRKMTDLTEESPQEKTRLPKKEEPATTAPEPPQKKTKKSGLSLKLPIQTGQASSDVDEDDEEVLPAKEEPKTGLSLKLSQKTPALTTTVPFKVAKKVVAPAPAAESKEKRKARILYELEKLELQKKEIALREQLRELEEDE